jgi:uncharacterized protein
MTLKGVTDERMREVLAKHLTPSLHITTAERLYGRERRLLEIKRAFNSPGRHIFIHGDRGVGKTSLALTAANLQQTGSEEPIYILCSSTSDFGDLILAIGNAVVPVRERLESEGSSAKLGASMGGFGGSFEKGRTGRADLQKPTDINSAIDIMRYVLERRTEPPVIVIDELERLSRDEDKTQLAEFINSLSSAAPQIKIILAGIGSTVDDLLGAHQSAVRKLENIALDRIRHDELWKIITSVSGELGVEIDRDALIRISILSDGFPHYVHLIGEALFWSMFDDAKEVRSCTPNHFKAGVKGALERTEAEHKSLYQKATQKTKNSIDYEHALWALADRSDTRRQLTSIYDDSYSDISKQASLSESEKLKREPFNQRLQRLRAENHGNVIVGHGAGWFSFKENILRGYVRLVAENSGVILARDNYIPK